jgi:hypothetical protein
MMATQIITKERNKMPNWCDTVLTIEGDVNLVSQINEHAENYYKDNSSDTFFGSFIPRPVSEDSNWYDWNLDNWGTKWDACNMNPPAFTDHGDGTAELVLIFDTAWSPAMPIFQHLLELGLSVTAEYEDEGLIFAGRFENGDDISYDIVECECIDEGGCPDSDCEKCYGNGLIIIK